MFIIVKRIATTAEAGETSGETDPSLAGRDSLYEILYKLYIVKSLY